MRVLNTGALQAINQRELDQALAWASECRALAQLNRQTPIVVEFLALCTTMEGRAHWLKPNLDRATTAFRAAIQLREAQVRDSPANNGIRRNLMLVHSHLSGALFSNSRASLKDLPGALAAMNQVREQAAWIAQSDPADRLAQRDLAIAGNRYGDLLFASKDYAKAAAVLEESIAMTDRLIAELPEDFVLRNEQLFSLNRLGSVVAALPAGSGGLEGNLEKVLRRAVAVADGMDGFGAITSSMYSNLAIAYARLGKLLATANASSAEAQRMMAKAVSVYRRGLEKYPNSSELLSVYQRELAAIEALVPKSH